MGGIRGGRMVEPPSSTPDANEMPSAADRFDENGNVKLDSLIDEDGNPTKQYPLPADPRDRRSEFENTIMRAYMTKLANENGTEPPPRVYQSEFDRKFHELCDRNWDRYERLRAWAEESAPRTLRVFDKTHDVMFYIGEKCADALGLTKSRYQWVIDAAEWQAYQEQKEREEEEEAMRELQEEEDRQAAADAANLEGGMQEMELSDTFQDAEQSQTTEEVESTNEGVQEAAEAPASETLPEEVVAKEADAP